MLEIDEALVEFLEAIIGRVLRDDQGEDFGIIFGCHPKLHILPGNAHSTAIRLWRIAHISSRFVMVVDGGVLVRGLVRSEFYMAKERRLHPVLHTNVIIHDRAEAIALVTGRFPLNDPVCYMHYPGRIGSLG